MKTNRLLNQIYAFLKGYWWLPCSLCGDYYGAHERAKAPLMESPCSGISVCKDCATEANVHTRLMYKRFDSMKLKTQKKLAKQINKRYGID